MTLNRLTYARALQCALLAIALAACGDSTTPQEPGDVINIGFEPGDGCAQTATPSDEPDLFALSPPRFLLTTSSAQQSSVGQAQVRPGSEIEAEVAVNAATRRVSIELADAWSPAEVIDSDELTTSGNETIELLLTSDENVRGRYYMRITLCGSLCSEREVVFDTVPCDDDEREPGEPCGINAPYQRTVIEAGEIVRVDETCIDLGAFPGQGSGTVLIQ